MHVSHCPSTTKSAAYQVHSSSDKVIFHAWTVLRSAASHKHHGVLLNIVTCNILLATISHRTISPQSAPSPGIYAVMTVPLLNLTLATFLSPELGFFGFVVPTRRHTPFISGLSVLASAGDVGFLARCPTRHPRRTWLYVACDGVVLEKARCVRCDRGLGVGFRSVLKQLRAVGGSLRIEEKSLDAIVGYLAVMKMMHDACVSIESCLFGRGNELGPLCQDLMLPSAQEREQLPPCFTGILITCS